MPATPTARPLAPHQRLRRWRVFLWVWRLHSVLGLSAALFIVLASVSGSLLVVHHDLERWLWPERHRVPPPTTLDGEPPALADLVREIAATAPADFRPLRIQPGHANTDAWKLVFVASDRTTRWSAFFDPSTGRVLWRGPDQALFTPWLLHLHMHLQMGTIGYWAMAFGSLALTLLAVTGIVITRGRLRLLLRRPMRLGRGWRVAAADLHRWTGLVSLYFSFVLGATGLWFSYLIVPSLDERAEPLPPPFDLRRLAPLEPAVARAQQQWPEAELARIILPWDDGVGVQVRVLHRDAPIWRKMSRIEVDAATGEVRRVRDARDASRSQQFQSILGPLHFGYYGSGMVKALYALGGLAPALLTITGTIIWWRRRRGTAAGAGATGRATA